MNYENELNLLYEIIRQKFTILKQTTFWNLGYILLLKSLSTKKIYRLKIYPNFLKSRDTSNALYKELVLTQLIQQASIKFILTVPKISPVHIGILHDPYETDLKSIINSRCHLSKDHAQFFLYSIFYSLYKLHNLKIVHRNLNPENILINSNEDFLIINFELCCSLNSTKIPKFPTEFTEYCRIAPEELLNTSQVYLESDVWTLGCLLVEMIVRRPLFSGDGKEGVLQNVEMVFGEGNECYEYLKDILGAFGEDCVDLAVKMLRKKPESRPRYEEILRHEFFKDVFFEEDFDDDYRKGELNLDFTGMVFSEIQYLINSEIREINLKHKGRNEFEETFE